MAGGAAQAGSAARQSRTARRIAPIWRDRALAATRTDTARSAMTFSIVARDPETGALRAAVASKFFAVGAICTYAEGGVGALSTQALVNPMYGPLGMARLRAGEDPQAIVTALTGPDPGRDQRQLHIIDAQGRIAQHTGPNCVTWAGHVRGADVSAAGNMLTGPDVVEAMVAGFSRAAGGLIERLLAALEAGGEAGGGERRRAGGAGERVAPGPPPPP